MEQCNTCVFVLFPNHYIMSADFMGKPNPLAMSLVLVRMETHTR